jgi:hypothetical protein
VAVTGQIVAFWIMTSCIFCDIVSNEAIASNGTKSKALPVTGRGGP